MIGGGLMPVLYSGIILRLLDQTDMLPNQLRDRGAHQALGFVTNAQDVMYVFRYYAGRWEQVNHG